SYQKIEFNTPIKDVPLTRHINPYPFVPSDKNQLNERCEDILTIQTMGLVKRLSHTNIKRVVIGLSGGLDSTLALLVAYRAFAHLKLDRKGIIAITMPCFGTTKRTKNNAIALSEALKVTLKEIDITFSVKQHFADINHDENVHDVTFENSQARERTQVLMDIANSEGALVIGTGDLSELALGWATYNGDHMSMYGVNASIPKTLVRTLVRHEADSATEERVTSTLIDILNTPVSPELLPSVDGEISQVTEHIVGPYELHDFFIFYGIRWDFTPTKVFHLARHAFVGIYDEATILKWMRVFYSRFFSQQFKRSCMPDGPKVGSASFSPRGDLRMPSDASSALWMNEVDELISSMGK
ncbi:MAG: NAD(+) synthase, partial [Spirochaetia bacterium]|nr:NAD(+) synthase [Spirochaetia bacterium]